MNQTVAQLPHDSSTQGIYRSLKDMQPFVEERERAGCGVAVFMAGYLRRATAKGEGPDNLILQHCSHEWKWGSTKPMGVAEFSIISKTLSPGSTLLRVKRVAPTDAEWSRTKALGHVREFAKTAADRLRYSDPVRSQTVLALGDTIKILIGMGGQLVDFRVDNGLHLLLRERPRCHRFLDIYIGGWMDEVKYPLQNYEQLRKVNPLRK